MSVAVCEKTPPLFTTGSIRVPAETKLDALTLNLDNWFWLKVGRGGFKNCRSHCCLARCPFSPPSLGVCCVLPR